MENFIIIAVLVLILGVALSYVIKAKKSGKKCIGCPDSATCGSKSDGGCSGNCCNCQK